MSLLSWHQKNGSKGMGSDYQQHDSKLFNELNIPHFSELMNRKHDIFDQAIINKLDRIEQKLDVLLEEKRMNDLAKKYIEQEKVRISIMKESLFLLVDKISDKSLIETWVNVGKGDKITILDYWGNASTVSKGDVFRVIKSNKFETEKSIEFSLRVKNTEISRFHDAYCRINKEDLAIRTSWYFEINQ